MVAIRQGWNSGDIGPAKLGIAGDQWLFWRERSGRIRVNPLPTLADIDRQEAVRKAR